MEHFKNFTKCIIFMLILGVSLCQINQVLEQKAVLVNNEWPSTSTYKQFYKMDRDSVDVLFLGSSVVANAFVPQVIYDEYGIRSYNLSAEQQSLFLNYYWLKEALRFQSPKVVVLDLKFLCDMHEGSPINMDEGLIRKSLDPMKWSPVKMEAVHTLCGLDDNQTEKSYYLSNIRYHGRWTDLNEYDFDKEYMYSVPLYGYAPTDVLGEDTFDTYIQGDTGITTDFQPVMQEYLDKIVALCNENGITLVTIDLPGNYMDDAINNTHQLYSQFNHVDYYNLCSTELYNQIGAVLPYENVVNHQNYAGAIKTSHFIGGLLRNNYGIQPTVDQQYESSKGVYEKIIADYELAKIYDMNQYFDALHDDHYAVFVASCGDSADIMNDNIKANMKKLGLTVIDYVPQELSYYAVIIENEVAKEEYSADQIGFMGELRNRKISYSIDSCGRISDGYSSIVIDDLEYSRMQKGLNVVAYDLDTGKVVDSVTIIDDTLIRD